MAGMQAFALYHALGLVGVLIPFAGVVLTSSLQGKFPRLHISLPISYSELCSALALVLALTHPSPFKSPKTAM